MKKKAKKTASTPQRTQISISLSHDLVKRIDAMAVKQNRNRSNYISNCMLELANKAK